MVSTFSFIILIGLFCFLLRFLQKRMDAKKHLLVSLFLGVGFGFLLKIIQQYSFHLNYASLSQNVHFIIEFYLKLLTIIAFPVIAISLLKGFLSLNIQDSFYKVSFLIIGLLLLGSLLGASIACVSTLFSGILQDSILKEALQNSSSVAINSAPLTHFEGSSPISITVIFLILGIAAASLKNKNPLEYEPFTQLIDNLYKIIFKGIQSIFLFLPYILLLIISDLILTISPMIIMPLINFIILSYGSIMIVFLIQLSILFLCGISPKRYLSIAASPLFFGFCTRSSLATYPQTIDTLKKLGVSENITSITSSLGISIGQTGCAGIYPAMLAMIVAPSVGIDPFNIHFILKIILLTGLCSLGIIGVGGGATISSLLLFSLLHFPVTIITLTLAIEPLIDGLRTALNIHSNLFTGMIAQKILKI